MKKKSPFTPIKELDWGTVRKNKVQTTILYSINNISFIPSNLEKKIPSPLLKPVFRGQFQGSGGSLLKKGGANKNIGLDR